MEYKKIFEKFKEFAENHEKKNIFGSFDLADEFPITSEQLKNFYKDYNPLDVEIDLGKNGVLRFFSGEELMNIQQEYALDNYLVFAELEGDPVVIKDGSIYISVHGTGQFDFEMINDDFVSFLMELMDGYEKFL